VDRVYQEGQAPAAQAVANRLEVVADLLGVERLVEGRWVRPTEHLLLEVGVGNVLEELAEAVEQVAFRDDDEDGESDLEDALDLVELFGDAVGLPLDLVGGVGDQSVGRYD